MTLDVGLWIDHREATIVTLADKAEDVKHIVSGMEKHVRFGGVAEKSTGEDNRDRRFANHLNQFFEEVINSLRAADSILIFGPGEAKGELAKRLEIENLSGRVIGVETVDKMTEPQIAAMVRERFTNRI
jgi:stalled ribosome rescue protein Dom34